MKEGKALEALPSVLDYVRFAPKAVTLSHNSPYLLFNWVLTTKG